MSRVMSDAAGPRGHSCAYSTKGRRFAALTALLFGSQQSIGADAPAPIETIVVRAQKLTVETLIDRKVYNVASDIQSDFGSVSDILSVIPSIDVDSEGAVSLRGDSKVLILIDGRPSSLFSGPSAGENLQSIPASDIERIEVITNPPAQYKADGTAGVINIVMRKKRAQGLTGSVQGSLGNSGRSLLGSTVSYSTGKLTTSLTGGYRHDSRRRLLSSDLTSLDPITAQISDSASRLDETITRAVVPLSGSLRYDLSDRQSVTIDGSRTSRSALRTYSESFVTTEVPDVIAGSSSRRSVGRDREISSDLHAGFLQKFGSAGEELSVTASRTFSREHEHYDYENFPLQPPAPAYFNNLGFQETRESRELDADYTRPVSKSQTLTFGYSFAQENYDYEAAGSNPDPLTGLPLVDPALTDNFGIRQQIHALYGNYHVNVGAWSWLGGLRAERAALDIRQITDGVSTGRTYTRVYPSIHVDRVLSAERTLSFAASRRVSRPDPDNFNSYVDHEYLPNLSTGNPQLRPQLTQAFEATYGYESASLSYAFTAYYRRNRDGVTDLVQNLGNGATLTTKTNLPRNDSEGLEVTSHGNLPANFSYAASINAFRSEIDATALGYSGLQSTSGINAKLKVDYHPTALDSGQVSVNRNDRRLTPQGYVSALNIVNAGYKRLLSKELSAVVTVSDLFNGQRLRRLAVTPTFTQRYERDVRGRVVFVGLVYAFGGSKKERQSSFEYE